MIMYVRVYIIVYIYNITWVFSLYYLGARCRFEIFENALSILILILSALNGSRREQIAWVHNSTPKEKEFHRRHVVMYRRDGQTQCSIVPCYKVLTLTNSFAQLQH